MGYVEDLSRTLNRRVGTAVEKVAREFGLEEDVLLAVARIEQVKVTDLDYDDDLDGPYPLVDSSLSYLQIKDIAFRDVQKDLLRKHGYAPESLAYTLGDNPDSLSERISRPLKIAAAIIKYSIQPRIEAFLKEEIEEVEGVVLTPFEKADIVERAMKDPILMTNLYGRSLYNRKTGELREVVKGTIREFLYYDVRRNHPDKDYEPEVVKEGHYVTQVGLALAACKYLEDTFVTGPVKARIPQKYYDFFFSIIASNPPISKPKRALGEENKAEVLAKMGAACGGELVAPFARHKRSRAQNATLFEGLGSFEKGDFQGGSKIEAGKLKLDPSITPDNMGERFVKNVFKLFKLGELKQNFESFEHLGLLVDNYYEKLSDKELNPNYEKWLKAYTYEPPKVVSREERHPS